MLLLASLAACLAVSCSDGRKQIGYYPSGSRERALRLHGVSVAQGALKDAGIEPSSNQVSTRDFLAALTNKFQYEPILFCDSDRSGNKYIDSVCPVLPSCGACQESML